MGVKVHKKTTPARRDASVLEFFEVVRKKPLKKLVKPLKRSGGRDNKGQVAVRGRGGGHKKKLRMIDFKRDKRDIEGRVEAIEYDPARNANIALLLYEDGERRYILAPLGLKQGEKVVASEKAEIKVGNFLPLNKIPAGTIVHNLEMKPGKGGQIVRAAGTGAVLMSKEGKYAQVKMPSGEVRLIPVKCWATIGAVGNADFKNIKLGKAGKKRWRGKKSKVRGVVQHPGSHPHGGGEGRSGVGMPSPKSPWGKKTLGKKTRKPKKYSDKMIIKRRK